MKFPGLAFAHGQIERNLAEVMAGQSQARRAMIAQQRSATLRRANLAMLELVERHPNGTARLLRRTLPIGAKYLGGGSQHTVIFHEGRVLKIHRLSAFMSDSKRRALADEFNELHRAMRRYLADFVIPQRATVAVNPLSARRDSVVSEQAYVDFTPTGGFAPYEPRLDREVIVALMGKHAGLRAQLHDFAGRALLLQGDTGFLVDVSGSRNVVMCAGQKGVVLRCLDGVPIRPDDPRDEQRILGQLQQLAALTK